MVTGLHFLFELALGIDSHIKVLLQEGPGQFLKAHFTAAIAYFILYPLYVILASAIIGAYGLPDKVSTGIANFPRRVAAWFRYPRWLPVPQEAYPQEPVWFRAFHSLTEGYTKSQPYVMVTLKSGDAYFGKLTAYAIVQDTENEKDFLITHALYYKKGELDQGQQMDSLDGVGAVLLNTANVDSIRIYYHDIMEENHK